MFGAGGLSKVLERECSSERLSRNKEEGERRLSEQRCRDLLEAEVTGVLHGERARVGGCQKSKHQLELYDQDAGYDKGQRRCDWPMCSHFQVRTR